jgi:hypothetical protein
MTKRHFAALAVCVAVSGAVVALPAGAQTAETLDGKAKAEALVLNVFGQGLTLGDAEVAGALGSVNSLGKGHSLDTSSTVEAKATPSALSSDPERKCAANLGLPDRNEVLVDLACGDAKADLVNDVPSATADGLVGSVDLNMAPELSEQVIAPVQEGLEGVFGQLPDELDPVTDTVNDLLTEIADEGNLVTVGIGDAHASMASEGSKLISTSTAEGARIELFPGAGLPVEGVAQPLATIIVGQSIASATCDRAAGTASTAFDPAIVRVVLAAPVLGEVKDIPVAAGEPVTILEGTPLESTISLGASSETKNDDGSVSGVADGVSLHLLKGIPEAGQGVRLALAHSEVSTGCNPAVSPTTTEAAAPAPPGELPRTGGDMPILPIAGAGLLGLAVALRKLVGARRAA